MKKVYLIRHAKAIPGDFDKGRPLSKAGHKQMDNLREKEAKLFKSLDLILCSTAVRAKETLEGMKACLSKDVVIHYLDHLYSATANIILNEISGVEDQFNNIMIVGHNPEMTDFVLNVCDHNQDPFDESMPKAGIAEFSLKSDSWGSVSYGDLTFIQLIE